jgi:UDPglucose 6-dehydrogenase
VALEHAKHNPALKGVTFCKDAYECAKGADAMALVTEWSDYKDLDFKKLAKLMHNPLLLDGRNLYDPVKLRKLGFTYHSVGRP